MEYKNIEDFNPASYACYAITSIKEDFTLNTVHPSGLQEYLDYDIYDLEDKTLIAFTKISFYRTYFVFRVVSENHVEDINAENYEYVADVLDESYHESNYVFTIMNSAGSLEDENGEHDDFVEKDRRCDLEDYAAINFKNITFDGKPDILDRDFFNDQNIIGWSLFLSSMGNVYIVKLRMGNIQDSAYKDWSGCVIMGQTFMYVMKMAYEWNLLAQEPWNGTQKIASNCYAAFNDWDMPEEVLNEIKNINTNTSIELFLSGDENPRRSIVEEKTIPPNFKKWYMSKLRYRTIYSLINNYPETLDIPQTIIDQEAQYFEDQVYNYMIENTLDPTQTNSAELLDHVYKSHTYENKKNKNNSVDDIIIKYFGMQEEEKQLIQDYIESNMKPVIAKKE